MIKNYIIGGLFLALALVIFLGKNYYEDRLKSAEEALNQRYEKSISEYEQRIQRIKLERDDLFYDLADAHIRVKNSERLDSIQATKKPRTYEELHNKDLENKMIEVFKERN